MSTVISMELSRKNEGSEFRGIVFYKNAIESFISLPEDYSFKDIVEIVETADSNCTYILDSRGIGMVLKDKMSTKNMIEPERNIWHYLENAKSSLMEIAINSNLDTNSKIEFKKLIKELDNLEVDGRFSGFPNLKSKEVNIGKGRAICYLNYYAYSNTIKI
jgi:hypothetical protein